MYRVPMRMKAKKLAPSGNRPSLIVGRDVHATHAAVAMRVAVACSQPIEGFVS
jgi:hypothetical protein